MSAEIIGHITCPLCGNDSATVHAQQRGGKKGARYVRCYTSPGGVTMRCGTLQCIGPTGQAYIDQHMRAIAPEPSEPPAPAPIAPPAQKQPENQPAPVPKGPPPRRGGLLSSLAHILSEE